VRHLPEGVSNDPTRNAAVYADSTGEVRFYEPPQNWGTVLTLECTLNGDPKGTYLVDLNDSSTFKGESKSELQPHVVGSRPALTGDLSTISPGQLQQQGYPPRPDPVSTPTQYAHWVQKVTQPADLINAVPVAELGVLLRVRVFGIRLLPNG
jgi:hypothetical protein